MRENVEDQLHQLNARCVQLYELGEYQEAKETVARALALSRAHLGRRHPLFATSLQNLGDLYRITGDYAKSEPLLQQALKIRRRILSDDDPELAFTLNNLGLLYQAMGRYWDGEPLLQEALAVRQRALGEDHLLVVQSLNNLAFLYFEMGRYTDAEPLYERARDLVQAAWGDQHPYVAAVLNNLGMLYHVLGRYAQARPLYEQALAITRAALGPDHTNVAQSLNNLAALSQDIGHYATADSLYREALAIQVQTLGAVHPYVAQSLDNLGELYRALDQPAKAEPLLRQALEIRRRALGSQHPAVARSLNRLAVLHSDQGDRPKAEPLLREALRIQRKVLGEGHPEHIATLNNLACLYHDAGRYEKAEELYGQALKQWRSGLGEQHPRVALGLSNLAHLCAATGRELEALALMEQAATIHDRMIGHVFSLGSESERLAYLGTIQNDFEAFLSLVLQHLPQHPRAVEKAFELVLRRKAIAAEALAVQHSAVLGGQYPSLRPNLQELASLRAQIARKALAGPGAEGLQAHRRLLAVWGARRELLECELVRQIPEMALEQRLQEVDRQAVAAALHAGEALVELVRVNVRDFRALGGTPSTRWKPAHYLAFVLLADAPDAVHLVDLGETAAIDQMIAAFQTSVGRGDRRVTLAAPEAPTCASDGSALRAAVFDPLVPAIGGSTRLFLAPAGDLALAPFEALPQGHGRHLVDDYRISYLGAGRDLLRFGVTSARRPGDSLVTADPDFDLRRGWPLISRAVTALQGRLSRDFDPAAWHFGRLEGTRVEGERIAAMLGVRPLLQGAALERRVKTACRSPRLLHIATHGFFLPNRPPDPSDTQLAASWVVETPTRGPGRLFAQRLENPLLRSGLALAGANTWLRGGSLPEDAEDGILTAEDVTGLDLLATELAVLSACETGLGDVHVGEGVFGLRRAFILAGAKTLVMSLWKVPDQETERLMTDFYRRVLAGEPRADALREAQLAMKALRPDPFYWGAFICQGDPSPLPPPQPAPRQ